MRRRTLSALPLLLAAACGPGSSDAAHLTLRDSAGIHIVESDGPAWGPDDAWRIADQPMLEVGADQDDPDYQFTSMGGVRGALPLDGGGFAVLDGVSNTLRGFGQDGRLLWTAGRHGGGPGEFQLAWTLAALPPDSLLVFDRSRATLSVFTEQGDFVRSVVIDAPGGLSSALWSVVPTGRGFAFGPTGGTTALVEHPAPMGVSRERGPLLRIGLDDGVAHDTIGVFPGMAWFKTTAGVGPLPFTGMTSVAARDSTLVVGTGEDVAVELRDLAGRLNGIVRVSGIDLSVTDADMEAHNALMMGLVTDENMRKRIQEMVDATPRPDRKGAYSSILVDGDGNLWLMEIPVGTLYPEGARVISREGRYLGVVRFPENFKVLWVGSDRILACRTDELDVPHVGFWALEK